MSLLFNSTGHEAIGHPPDPQNPVLIAGVGSFTFTGESVLFNNAINAATGVFVLTGEPANSIKVFPGSPSGLDPNSMAVLGIANTQTLLYDYGASEDFYLLDTDQVPPLYYVGSVYAKSWFRVTQGHGLRVFYNPFTRVVF